MLNETMLTNRSSCLTNLFWMSTAFLLMALTATSCPLYEDTLVWPRIDSWSIDPMDPHDQWGLSAEWDTCRYSVISTLVDRKRLISWTIRSQRGVRNVNFFPWIDLGAILRCTSAIAYQPNLNTNNVVGNHRYRSGVGDGYRMRIPRKWQLLCSLAQYFWSQILFNSIIVTLNENNPVICNKNSLQQRISPF